MARRAVTCVLAGPGFDAAAHVLAHAPVIAAAPALVRAASLHDPRYVAWCSRSLDQRATDAASRDGPLLAALLARTTNGHLLQALLGLHASAEAHEAGAAHELDRCGGAGWAVDALHLLAADHAELVAIARCAVGLVARPYAAAWRSSIQPALEAARPAVEEHLALVAATAPSCVAMPVALSHPIGPRGRALPGLVVVGAPVGWAEVDAARAAAIAVHERAVAAASELAAAGQEVETRWAVAEALALAAVPRVLPRGAVADAHRRHLASLDTSALGPADPVLVAQLVARLAARPV